MPGFALAKRCRGVRARRGEATSRRVMVLERHGIFTWGATAKESYERTIAAVTRAERHVARHAAGPCASPRGDARASARAARRSFPACAACWRARGDPPERGPIVADALDRSAILAFLARPDVAELVAKGCATPDHVLRTKPTALARPRPAYADAAALAVLLERERREYAGAVRRVLRATCARRRRSRRRSSIRGRASCSCPASGLRVGATASEADIALDVYEHTIDVMTARPTVGAYAPVSRGGPLRRRVLEPRAGEDQADDAGAARPARRARDGGGVRDRLATRRASLAARRARRRGRPRRDALGGRGAKVGKRRKARVLTAWPT